MIAIRLMLIMMLFATVHVHAADQRELNRQLYNALLNGLSLETVQELIEQDGADIAGVTEFSLFKTPALHLAAKGQESPVLIYLIECGVDVNGKDNDGLTACHYAASHNRAASIRILFDKGAHIDAKSRFKHTPLHSACREGAFNAAQTLLARGVNAQEKNAENKTPLDIAQDGGYQAIVKLLEDYESIPDAKEPEED